MTGRATALVLLSAFAAGCGDSVPAGAPLPPDLKGTPFVVAKPKAPPPAAPDLGDVDSAPPAEPPAAAAPVEPAPSPEPPPPAAPPQAEGQYESTSFDELSGFACAAYAAEAGTKYEIPKKILALSGKRIVLDGFMMPLQYEAGGAKKFLLMRYQFGCCYAVTPKINEWIEVTMEGGAIADYIPDALATVWGTLEVKEEIKDGVTSGLYKMRATKNEITEAK
jgi:hypothetical protein